MACAVAVRAVGDVGVEEDDAEAAARSRRAMERCTQGAGVVAISVPIPLGWSSRFRPS